MRCNFALFCSFKALANENTLLPTQMFSRLPARATSVADTNFVSGTQKMFLILFRNILFPQQMFPSLHSPRNIMGNNVSATMSPRLPGPLALNCLASMLDCIVMQMRKINREKGYYFCASLRCTQIYTCTASCLRARGK